MCIKHPSVRRTIGAPQVLSVVIFFPASYPRRGRGSVSFTQTGLQLASTRGLAGAAGGRGGRGMALLTHYEDVCVMGPAARSRLDAMTTEHQRSLHG